MTYFPTVTIDNTATNAGTVSLASTAFTMTAGTVLIANSSANAGTVSVSGISGIFATATPGTVQMINSSVNAGTIFAIFGTGSGTVIGNVNALITNVAGNAGTIALSGYAGTAGTVAIGNIVNTLITNVAGNAGTVSLASSVFTISAGTVTMNNSSANAGTVSVVSTATSASASTVSVSQLYSGTSGTAWTVDTHGYGEQAIRGFPTAGVTVKNPTSTPLLTKLSDGTNNATIKQAGASTSTLTYVQPVQHVDSTGKVLMGDATTINEYNVSLSSTNTEYSQALPSNTKAIDFWNRSNDDIFFAFTTGKVAGTVSPYFMLKSGQGYSRDLLNLTSKTVYFAGTTTGNVIELLAWS